MPLHPNEIELFKYSLPNYAIGLNPALDLVPGVGNIHKFGRNSGIDINTVPEDIWDLGGTYTFSTTPDIDSISSSDSGDNQEITVIGLDENWLEVSQNVILDGQNRVELPIPLVRCYRAFNIGSTDIAGMLYIYVNGAITNGVPNDLTTVRAVINDGTNQTLMAIYTVPANKYGLFSAGYAGLSRKTATFADLEFRTRDFGSVFRTQFTIDVPSTGTSFNQYKFITPLLVSPKTDILVRAIDVSANATAVFAGFEVRLIDV